MDDRLAPFFDEAQSGELVIGCYLWPGRFLVENGPADPVDAISLIRHVEANGMDIMITGEGGLYVRPPAELPRFLPGQDPLTLEGFEARVAFEQEVAQALNIVICQLCLEGMTSEPAAPGALSSASMIEGRVFIKSSKRVGFGERNIQRGVLLIAAPHLLTGSLLYTPFDRDYVLHTEPAMKLAALSPTVPAFVAGAYSLYMRDQWAEGMVDGWVVIEQYIDSMWTDLTSEQSSERKSRLKDSRTYSAAVRLEMLLTDGRITAELYEYSVLHEVTEISLCTEGEPMSQRQGSRRMPCTQPYKPSSVIPLRHRVCPLASTGRRAIDISGPSGRASGAPGVVVVPVLVLVVGSCRADGSSWAAYGHRPRLSPTSGPNGHRWPSYR